MLAKGQVVRSLAGRDKNSLMAVTDSDELFVYVADGRERRLSSPKRKNPRHIADMHTAITDIQMQSDKALRKALAVIEADNEKRR